MKDYYRFLTMLMHVEVIRSLHTPRNPQMLQTQETFFNSVKTFSSLRFILKLDKTIDDIHQICSTMNLDYSYILEC